MTNEERYRQREGAAVRSKLLVEGVDLFGDWVAVKKCLSQTVSPQRCIEVAKRLRRREALSQGVIVCRP